MPSIDKPENERLIPTLLPVGKYFFFWLGMDVNSDPSFDILSSRREGQWMGRYSVFLLQTHWSLILAESNFLQEKTLVDGVLMTLKPFERSIYDSIARLESGPP